MFKISILIMCKGFLNILLHCVKMCYCNWFNRERKGQQLGSTPRHRKHWEEEDRDARGIREFHMVSTEYN